MAVAGIDGCRGGWFAFYGNIGDWSFEFSENLPEPKSFSQVKLIFIDMPIGLSSHGFSRQIDRLARLELSPGKTSTVFTPPCRQALSAKDYKEALEINRELTGKGISIQAWNLSDKICAVEQLLLNNPALKAISYESHPEISIKYLNGHHCIMESKRASAGYRARVDLIANYDSKLVQEVERAISVTLRKHAAKDDIVDAAVLALSASYAHGGTIRLVGDYDETDEAGLPVRIAFGVAR